MFNRKKVTTIIGILTLIVLSSAIYYSGKAINQKTEQIEIQQGQRVGQTFTAMHAGLDSITLYLNAPSEQTAELIVRLFENLPEKSQKLEVSHIVASDRMQAKSLSFPEQHDSYLKDYYFEVEWTGKDDLIIASAPAESYDQGSLYVEGKPVEAQLLFEPHYDKLLMVWGLIKQGMNWSFLLFLTGIVFITPGWALLVTVWKPWSAYDLITKIASASALSLGIYPLLMLITDHVKLYPGEVFFVWTVFAVSVGILVFHYRSLIKQCFLDPRKIWRKIISELRKRLDLFGIAALFIIVLIILVRLWAIRTLSTPMWGDSYQHTVITQLILDHGGLFNSWQPYAPYESLTIHFGFHVNSALLAWISGLSASRAVIWMGQVVNILAVIAIYPLAKRVSDDSKWSGVIAMLTAGLFLSLPNFYVNWGRYPQLCSQAMLPIMVLFILDTLFPKDTEKGNFPVTTILLAGMLLCYYRSALFLLLFFPIILYQLFIWSKSRIHHKASWIWKGFAIVLLAILLLSPLYPRLMEGRLVTFLPRNEPTEFADKFMGTINSWRNITRYYPTITLSLTAAGIIISLFRKSWSICLLPIGVLLLQGYALGVVIGLPLAEFIGVFSVLIILYIPIAMILGWFSDQAFRWFLEKNEVLSVVILMSLAVLGAYNAKNVLNKFDHEYVTTADLRAFDWIKINTEENSLFLVDGFTTYNGNSAVGSDAGWWIPYFTLRENTMPPQYALLDEKPEDPNYTKWVVSVLEKFRYADPTTSEGIEAACDWGISHIYIGQKQGLMNQKQPLLDWKNWQNTEAWTLIYAEDRVRLFELDQAFCQKK